MKDKVPKYSREIVYTAPDGSFEIVKTLWPPGSVSAIHNHGKSQGIVMVRKGELVESVYNVQSSEYRYSVKRCAGQVFQEDCTRVHKVENLGTEEAEVIYAYFPPLREEDMQTFPEAMFNSNRKATIHP